MLFNLIETHNLVDQYDDVEIALSIKMTKSHSALLRNILLAYF